MSTHLYEIVKVCYAIYIMEKIDIIDVKQIRTNPFQPRQTFVQEKLEELAASIKENGLIQPIIVRKSPIVGYELLAGERRYRAAQMAGFKEIPAIIRDLSDDDMIKQAIIENLQREDLNPIEEAESYQHLIDKGATHEEIAQFMGKSRPYISNMVRLLHLSPIVKEAIKNDQISQGHARILVPLKEDQQIYWLERTLKEGLSVRSLEEKVGQKKKRPSKKEKELFLAQEENRLKKMLGTEVEIRLTKQEKGSIHISFNNLDEYQRIINSLK